MSNRVGFALAAALLLLAAGLRLWNIESLPPGFHPQEITDIRITESVRSGNVAVFYNLETLGEVGGREGLYHILLAAITSITGKGFISYRILSVIVSLIMLAVAYALTKRLYGPLAGVAALAMLTLSMWPVLLARSVGRESLLPLLVAAVLLALACALPVYQQPSSRDREPGTTPFAALGLLLGLGFYLHPANFMLALGSMLFIAYMVISRQPLSIRSLSYIGFAILVMIIIAMPYLISSIRLPELAGAARVFGDYRVVDKAPLEAIFESIVGIFFRGDPDPAHNLPGRPLVDLVSGVIMIFGLLAAIRNWRSPRFFLPLTMLLALSPLAFLSINSPEFDHFVALLPVLALFFGLGVTMLYHSLPRRSRPYLRLGLLALLLFNGYWLARDLFQDWPARPDVFAIYQGRIGQLAQHIDRTAQEMPTVLCTPTVNEVRPQEELTDTQLLLLMMHTRGTRIRYADCGTGLVFTRGGEQQQVILAGIESLEDVHPYLRDWLLKGEIEQADNLPPDSVITMDVAATLGDTIGRFTTSAPVSYAPEAPGGAEIIDPPVPFGGNITFLGYEPEGSGSYQPGDIVTVISYWRVDGPLPPDVRLFTHILSDPAAIISQTDTLSVLPLNLHPRDIFVQVTFISLPESTPAGSYMLSTGAYQDIDDLRLPVLDRDGRERGNRLFLTANSITVE